MVANGLLTNPTLFSGSEITTEDCIQKWMDICYNSTLTADIYRDTCDSDDVMVSNLTIPERPLNLTFQIFQHHLVFMLEKVLPKGKRRVFNNLQTFESVLSFLYDNFKIKPRLYELSKFKYNSGLDLDYTNRDKLYFNLKDSCVGSLNESNYLYDVDKNEGKYFRTKVLSDLPNVEYNLSNMFI